MSALRWTLLFFVAAYVQAFDSQRFLKTYERGCPGWVKEQIEKDLASFAETGISQEAIERTWRQCVSRAGLHQGQDNVVHGFSHYRIINNCIYRKNHQPWLGFFDRMLVKLVNNVVVPDVEFVISLGDGVPEGNQDPSYWVMEDKRAQAPLFVRARKQGLNYLVLIPDYSAFDLSSVTKQVQEGRDHYPWEAKYKRAFWRGHLSDHPVPSSTNSDCFVQPRAVLSFLSALFPDQIDAGLINTSRTAEGLECAFPQYSSSYEVSLVKEHRSLSDHLAYAYLPCLDGAVCTYPGYYWRLMSNSLVLKAESEFELWFYPLLRPYEHYVPLRADCSDIIDVIGWARAHDHEVQLIVARANAVVKENLFEEANFAYVLYALEAYAKLQRFHLRACWQETQESSDWTFVGMGIPAMAWKQGF